MYDRLGEALKDVLQNGSIPSGEPQAEEVPSVDSNTEGASIYDKWTNRARTVHSYNAAGAMRTGQVLHANSEQDRVAEYTAQSFENSARQNGSCRANGQNGNAGTEETAYTKRLRAAYTVLGVKPTDSVGKVKAAWREKIKMFHPDSNSNNETVQRVAQRKTLEIMDAYQTLLDANVLK